MLLLTMYLIAIVAEAMTAAVAAGRMRIDLFGVITLGALTALGGGTVRDNPEVHRTIAGLTALGRVGQPDDVGAAVAALLSDGLGWMNGVRIEVSGGQGL